MFDLLKSCLKLCRDFCDKSQQFKSFVRVLMNMWKGGGGGETSFDEASDPCYLTYRLYPGANTSRNGFLVKCSQGLCYVNVRFQHSMEVDRKKKKYFIPGTQSLSK